MNDTLLVEGETGVTRLVSNRPDVPETLGEACRRALARRRARESVERAVITIEPVGIAGKESEFLGVAIIDQQWRNYIHNGESTVFRVRPGEHTVTVYFKSRPRGMGWRGLAKASRRVVVGPGERLDLALGVAKESTDVERSKVPVPMFLLFASFFLAFGIGWHISPILREIVVWATRALEIQRPWSSLFYFVVAERRRDGSLCISCVADYLSVVWRKAATCAVRACAWVQAFSCEKPRPGRHYHYSRHPTWILSK